MSDNPKSEDVESEGVCCPNGQHSSASGVDGTDSVLRVTVPSYMLRGNALSGLMRSWKNPSWWDDVITSQIDTVRGGGADVKSASDTASGVSVGNDEMSRAVFTLQEKFNDIEKRLGGTKDVVDGLGRDIENIKKEYSDGIDKMFEEFSGNVKGVETNVAGEFDRMKNDFKKVEDSIKKMGMRHVEVLGVFSAILALLISSASIASNMKTVFGACLVLAMMVCVVIVLVVVVSNVVNGHRVVDRTFWVPVVAAFAILGCAFLFDGGSVPSRAKVDEKAAVTTTDTLGVHAGAANATLSK